MVEGVAGVVQTEVITWSEVRELVGSKEKDARETLHGQEVVDRIKELRAEAIEELIDRKLILLDCKSRGLEISETDIDQRLQETVDKHLGGDRKALPRWLAAQGYTVEKYREHLRSELMIEQSTAEITKTASSPEEARRKQNEWVQALRKKAYIKKY